MACPGRVVGPQGFLGPGVLGIAAPKVFPHLMIGRLPEAVQVVGDLDWPVVRAEQVQQYGNAPSATARCFIPAKQLLKSGRQNRRPTWFIGQADKAAARNRDRLLGASCSSRVWNRVESTLQERNEIGLFDLIQLRFSVTDLFQQFGENVVTEIGPIELWDGPTTKSNRASQVAAFGSSRNRMAAWVLRISASTRPASSRSRDESRSSRRRRSWYRAE